MTSLLRAMLCGLFLAPGILGAQGPASTPPATASPFAGDERAAKLAERYKAMLNANPSEGMALDRLWKAYEERGAAPFLLEEYRRSVEAGGTTSVWLTYGHLLKKAGRPDDAAQAYATATKLDPANLNAQIAVADLALDRQQPGQAAAAYAAVLDSLPQTDRRREDLLFKAGQAWMADGQQQRAAESWEKVMALNPGNLQLRRKLAETFARHQLTDRALAEYAYLAEHGDPATRASAWRETSRLYESRGDFDAARNALDRALALTSRDNWLHGEILSAIIRLHERADKLPELERSWRAAVEQTPRDLGGYLRLEKLAEARGDVPARLAWLEKIVALAPRDRESRLRFARLLAEAGELGRAASFYDALLREQPDNAALVFERAELDIQTGSPDAGAARIEAVIARQPDDGAVTTPALEFFLKHHLDTAAEKHLRVAADKQPGAVVPATALARFYIGRRRIDEARRTLDALTARPGDAKARAQRWQVAADVYREENLAADAMRCWREVARIDPQNPAPDVAVGELLLARGDARGAADAWQRAVDVSPDGPPREELEHKLFQALRGLSVSRPGGSAPSAGRGSISLGGIVVTPGRVPTESVVPGSDLDKYLAGLARAAEINPSPAAYLRLARWQIWAKAPAEAAEAASEALALDPKNLQARESLANLDIETHQNEAAAERLRGLIEDNPARRTVYLHQLANLRMEEGDFDAALAVYGDLQEADPSSPAPLVDLAQAQQRADHWFDALATWKRAYALPALTPMQRGDIRRPLVAAYDRLGQPRPAADLLQAAVDEQPDLTRKQDLFRELTDFSAKHDLAAELAARYEAKLKASPDDYFMLMATATLRAESGQERESYDLLRRAFYSAPDPVAALKSLADAAEGLGEEEEAIAFRRRLLTMPGQGTAENLERLANQEEANLDDEAAVQTWEQIATRFPRDTAALAAAAKFYERAGQATRAREMLARAAAIDPGDPARLFRLGELHLTAGDKAAARACFEQLLAGTTPEKPDAPLRLPPDLESVPDPTVGTFGLTTFGRARPVVGLPSTVRPAADEQGMRLQAIRALSGLLPDPAARQAWLERWTRAALEGAKSEPLEAFYASGESARTLDLLAEWSQAQPGDASWRSAFLLAGLRMGDNARLARWTWDGDDPAQRGERGGYLIEAVQQFLAVGGKPGPETVRELFPAKVVARDLLWKAAKDAFAERRWYAQATELGERVLQGVETSKAGYAVEFAQWQLYLGQTDRARTYLREAIEYGGGSSFDTTSGSPVFEAMRMYFLLLPSSEQPAFVENYLRRCSERGEAVYGVLCGILLHGLLGDETAARRDVDTLLAMRPVGPFSGTELPDVRRWSFLDNAGAQLQSWNLQSVAVYLWQRALAEADPFDRFQSGVPGMIAGTRGRLAATEISLATDGQTACEAADAYLRSGPPGAVVASTAMQLMSSAHYTAAGRFYEHLVRLEPGDGESWRNLLSAWEGCGDTDAVERTLVALLASARPLPGGLNRPELLARLAMLRENNGEGDNARRLLEKNLFSDPRAINLRAQLADSFDRAGQPEEAARIWTAGVTDDPVNARRCRTMLANLEERRGRIPQAIAMAEADLSANGPGNAAEAKTRLVRLYARAGRGADAAALAERTLQRREFDLLPGVADALAAAGMRPAARELLSKAVRRARDPQSRFILQRAVVQQATSTEDVPQAEFLRELRRLKKFSQASPVLKSQYDFARNDIARQRQAGGWLEAELKEEWREGQGDFFAGDRLYAFYLEAGRLEELRAVVGAIDRRPNLPEQSLYSMEKRLLEGKQAALALPVAERLQRRFPQNEVYTLGRARALILAGLAGEADRLLESLDATFVCRDDLATQIGALYEDLGNPGCAADFYARAIRRDPYASRAVMAYVRVAQQEMQRRNTPRARALLQTVARRPAGLDLQPLVDFLLANNAAAAWSTGCPDAFFPLIYPKRAQVLALVARQLQGTDPEAARALAWRRPECFAGSATLTAPLAPLRASGPGSDVEATITAYESALAEGNPRSPRLERELAAWYLSWSDAASNDAGAAGQRLARLTRAHDLDPESFAVARALALVCWEQGQATQAVDVLQPFAADDALPRDRAEARRLLAQH